MSSPIAQFNRGDRLRILFVITGLEAAGAERMLLKLASGMSARFEPAVVSLTERGVLASDFERAGVQVTALRMSGPGSVPGAVARLVAHIRSWRPQVVSTWMYHADLIGGLASRLAGVSAVAWNIRNSDLSAERSARATRAVVRINARLSRWVPKLVLCCSEVAQQIHIDLGYAADRFLRIPNGFDLDQYRPMPEAGASVRQELDIAPGAPLIGLVGRWHPQKNHHGFIRAAELLRRRFADVHFLIVGSGCDPANRELVHWIGEAGLTANVRLLGQRSDIPRLTAALDIASSSSVFGEAFPNVLGEAMACAVPCVTTDVGDSAHIVADTGRVVPAGNSPALAAAWADLLIMPKGDRLLLGEAARERVRRNFELGAVRRRYEEVFLALATERQAAESIGARSSAE